jgi:quercetin dioxygenase-like cupin family protein
MNLRRKWFGIGLLLVSGMLAGGLASNKSLSSGSRDEAIDRARIVLSKPLPALNGSHLKATLVEVIYGPGESSSPHSHPCAVIGYVAQGTIRSEVQGQPETSYHAGESFYEAPNGVHLVSANASSTEPAKLLAYLVCDQDGPLSVDLGEKPQQGGGK